MEHLVDDDGIMEIVVQCISCAFPLKISWRETGGCLVRSTIRISSAMAHHHLVVPPPTKAAKRVKAEDEEWIPRSKRDKKRSKGETRRSPKKDSARRDWRLFGVDRDRGPTARKNDDGTEKNDSGTGFGRDADKRITVGAGRDGDDRGTGTATGNEGGTGREGGCDPDNDVGRRSEDDDVVTATDDDDTAVSGTFDVPKDVQNQRNKRTERTKSVRPPLTGETRRLEEEEEEREDGVMIKEEMNEPVDEILKKTLIAVKREIEDYEDSVEYLSLLAEATTIDVKRCLKLDDDRDEADVKRTDVTRKFKPKRLGVIYCDSGEENVDNEGQSNPHYESVMEYVDDDETLKKKKRPTKKEHRCVICNRVYQKPSHLIRHFRVHTGEKPYECQECGKRFPIMSRLNRHARRHTDERPYLCNVCGKDFVAQSDLRRHSEKHAERPPRHDCAVCGKSFSRNTHMHRHMLTHTGEKPFACTVCDKRFSKSDHIVRHMLTHTGEKRFRCLQCDKAYATNSDLVFHMAGHTGDKPFMCDVCGGQFIRQAHLVRHYRTHTGERPFRCETCGRAFTRTSHLRKHVVMHASNEEDYRCYVCAEAFVTAALLRSHVDEQHGSTAAADSFACDVCGEAFRTSNKLDRHVVKHLGGSPVYREARANRCDECGNVYRHPSGLALHKRSHTGEKPYVCEICACTFARSNSLVRHKRAHTGLKFHCTFCGQSYARIHVLKRHMLKKHQQLSTDFNEHVATAEDLKKSRLNKPAQYRRKKPLLGYVCSLPAVAPGGDDLVKSSSLNDDRLPTATLVQPVSNDDRYRNMSLNEEMLLAAASIGFLKPVAGSDNYPNFGVNEGRLPTAGIVKPVSNDDGDYRNFGGPNVARLPSEALVKPIVGNNDDYQNFDLNGREPLRTGAMDYSQQTLLTSDGFRHNS